jgi:hypothetical protein
VFGLRRSEIDAFVDFAEGTGTSVFAAGLAVVGPDPHDLPFLDVSVARCSDRLVVGPIIRWAGPACRIVEIAHSIVAGFFGVLADRYRPRDALRRLSLMYLRKL